MNKIFQNIKYHPENITDRIPDEIFISGDYIHQQTGDNIRIAFLTVHSHLEKFIHNIQDKDIDLLHSYSIKNYQFIKTFDKIKGKLKEVIDEKPPYNLVDKEVYYYIEELKEKNNRVRNLAEKLQTCIRSFYPYKIHDIKTIVEESYDQIVNHRRIYVIFDFEDDEITDTSYINGLLDQAQRELSELPSNLFNETILYMINKEEGGQ